MHPEDIKAELRKRNGSIANFIRANKLPVSGVSDLLGGRISRRVARAIASELNLPVTLVFPNISLTRPRPTSYKKETKPICQSRKREVEVAS
jgi:lambda repressor-like predicted transcriptional regulator